MKILLIQLYDGGEVEPVFPLGVAYLAASLTAHEVRVFDQNVTDSDPFLETPFIFIFSRGSDADDSAAAYFPERTVWHYYPDAPNQFYSNARQ